MQTSTSQSATLPARPLRHLDDLPGPRGLPIVGNALQIDPPHFHQQLQKPQELSQEHPSSWNSHL